LHILQLKRILSERQNSLHDERHNEQESSDPMTNEEPKQGQTNRPERQPYKVRLPSFISDKDIGLGDVIKRATSAVGMRPCGSCEQRAAALNRWLTFSGRYPK
jgi:hypothetical protein